MQLGLRSKRALVTGTSEGIGLAIAAWLAEERVRTAIYKSVVI
jgi:NAD(P)-dependent dehydrogenase (short-subunit alcohol dehydrogenase family)